MSEKNEVFEEMVQQLEENNEAKNNGFPDVYDLTQYGSTKSILLDVVFCGGGPSASYRLEVQEGCLVNAWLVFQNWGGEEVKQLFGKHMDMLEVEFATEIENATEGL